MWKSKKMQMSSMNSYPSSFIHAVPEFLDPKGFIQFSREEIVTFLSREAPLSGDALLYIFYYDLEKTVSHALHREQILDTLQRWLRLWRKGVIACEKEVDIRITQNYNTLLALTEYESIIAVLGRETILTLILGRKRWRGESVVLDTVYNSI